MRAIPRIKTRDSTQYCYDTSDSTHKSCQDKSTATATATAAATAPPPHISKFRYDPYGVSPLGRVYLGGGGGASGVGSNTEGGDATTTTSVAPSGTLHAELWGLVSFLPYPSTAFELPPDAIYPNEKSDSANTVRVFVGQLPYFITEMQLGWILYTFGGKNAVVRPERILKRNPQTGERLPTGCIHAVGNAEGLVQMSRLMHKRLLIDDTGVWFCRNETEYNVLWDYCQAMKRDIKLRPWERPYDSVVVQEATSGSHLRKQQQQQQGPSNRAGGYHHSHHGAASQSAAPARPPPPYYAGSAQMRGPVKHFTGTAKEHGRAFVDTEHQDHDDTYMAH